MRRIMILVLIGLVVIFSSVKAQDGVVNAQPADVLSDVKHAEFDTNQVYFKAEQMPQFPGGEYKLLEFIHQNLKYPVTEPDVQGKIYCRFIVNIDGTISNPEVLKSLEPECDKEAIRVIRLLPKFIPGKQNGKNVRVWYTIPITFKLE